MKPSDVLQLCKAEGVEIVDLRFTDFIGTLQHFSVPVSELNEDSFNNGFGFDGSSIRGWQAIEESDMLVVPVAASAKIDPFFEHKTLTMIVEVKDPTSGKEYSRDPRFIAKKAEAHLKSTGIADTANFGPELEFFLFNDVRFDQTAHHGFYFLDSAEGIWNSGAEEAGGNLAFRPRHKEGYFPAPPHDTLQDVRSAMVIELIKAGIPVEAHHHEVATAGQCEIDMRFDTLTAMADKTMMYKYIVRNVAKEHGLAATFMPKPLYGDNGSGMHVHQSLWKDGKPLFPGDKAAGLSELALWYIGGILKHAPALLAITNPTTNSYRRLVPGYEAPINLVFSSRNRSAAVRIPMYSNSPKAKRIEFRTPDGAANPYLAFSAMLMAGLDGIKNKIDPGTELRKNTYDLPAAEAKKIKAVPASLDEALRNLEADHAFLLEGGVFTKDVIETWIEHKYQHDVQQVRLRPVPLEFNLYFDC